MQDVRQGGGGQHRIGGDVDRPADLSCGGERERARDVCAVYGLQRQVRDVGMTDSNA